MKNKSFRNKKQKIDRYTDSFRVWPASFRSTTEQQMKQRCPSLSILPLNAAKAKEVLKLEREAWLWGALALRRAKRPYTSYQHGNYQDGLCLRNPCGLDWSTSKPHINF